MATALVMASFIASSARSGGFPFFHSQCTSLIKVPIKIPIALPLSKKPQYYYMRKLISFCSSDAHEDHDKTTEPIPKRHLKTYTLNGIGGPSNSPKSNAKFQNSSHTIRLDLPKYMGGADSAPQPVEHLLSALVGCTHATALFVARNMKPSIIIDRIEFELTATRDNRGAVQLPIVPNKMDAPAGVVPSRVQYVSGTVLVLVADGEVINDDQLKMLREQTELRCPVANMMISSGCDMTNVIWVTR
mmetsp:Transcript_33450/g.40519  ORF Transcript_33450/g.40519 Transcript_33450/m.40519 type:complete len:245 (+) Transcript_33450:235-969(+)